THLGEVDATWADVQAHKSDLSGLHEQINEITSKATETTEKIHADLAVLQQFQTLLESYTHLGEVDATWADVQAHKSDLSGLHEQINEIDEDGKRREEAFNKKLIIAYSVAGGSLALTIIHLVLRLIGIL
ncbi:MAG: hypothetical protein II905_11010, partial [Muribaculaceae bacterium]|nr:hypothetical protein [Muribaculaceae bacterium]